jgi:hypothetical protein
MNDHCCHACLGGELPRHMIVCRICGDKRCPKAENHRNDCQGIRQGPRRATEEELLRAQVADLERKLAEAERDQTDIALIAHMQGAESAKATIAAQSEELKRLTTMIQFAESVIADHERFDTENEERIAKLESAGRRFFNADYQPWACAGGPNSCAHGYADGIPCRDCDIALLKGVNNAPV